jgi:hypothetical protein
LAVSGSRDGDIGKLRSLRPLYAELRAGRTARL